MKRNKAIKRLIPLTRAILLSTTATVTVTPSNFFTLVENKLVKFDLTDLRNSAKKLHIRLS